MVKCRKEKLSWLTMTIRQVPGPAWLQLHVFMPSNVLNSTRCLSLCCPPLVGLSPAKLPSACYMQDDLAQQDTILLSLEACIASLHILAAPKMPKQVYQEELIDRLVALAKFHLVNNVLVFCDASICQANRPDLLHPGEPEFGVQPSNRAFLHVSVLALACSGVCMWTRC